MWQRPKSRRILVLIAFLALIVAVMACDINLPAINVNSPTAVSPTTASPTDSAGKPDLSDLNQPGNQSGKSSGPSSPSGPSGPSNPSGPSSGGGRATLSLVNSSGQTVCYVYISPTTSDSWGSDWLGSEEVIQPGSTRNFSVSAGTWALRADDCNGNALAEEYGVSVSGTTTWSLSGSSSGGNPPSSSGSVPLRLVNSSNSTVCYAYISPSTSDSWGSDWLGSSTVAAGSSYTFYVSSGTYDLKAEDCSNNVLDEQYGIQISASSTWTVYGGATNSGPSTSGDGSVAVTMTNYTPNTACYVYISPSTSDSWGSDWLGSSTVASQGSYTFWVTPGTYDLKAEDCSGNVLDELYGVSIYNSYSWPLYWAEPGVGPQSSDGMATLQVVNHVS
ncbi:MAG: hypothetical protein IT514_16455, partial [Burkholderiales bacterium]|nr:hypothetical protein [Burkholderiales bacterium]